MEIANFIEEDRSAMGLLELADATLGGAGEGTALVTEEFAFQEISGNGSAVDGDERLGGATAVLIDGAGDEFLAGAGLAENKDGDGGVGDATDAFVNFLHRFAIADEGVGLAAGRCFTEADFLEHQFGMAEGFGDEIEEFIGFEGFGEIFVSAEPGGFDGGFGAAVRGHHDDGELGRGVAKLLDELKAGEAGELEIGDDEIEARGAGALETFVAAADEFDLKAFAGENFLDGGAGAWVILNEENFRWRHLVFLLKGQW